jgi:hypothetical protein
VTATKNKTNIGEFEYLDLKVTNAQ